MEKVNSDGWNGPTTGISLHLLVSPLSSPSKPMSIKELDAASEQIQSNVIWER